MKKALTVIGFIFMLLFSTGSIFKLQHWPGASVLLVFSITILIVFFLPLFFLERILSNKSALNIATNTFGFFSVSLIFTGVMFKVQHWPGASAMLVSGSGLLTFPTLILYVFQQFKEENKSFGEYWKFVFLTFFVSVFFFTYGLNYSRNILYTYLQVEDQVTETNKSLKKFNAYLLVEMKNNNQDISEKAIKLDSVTKKLYDNLEDIKLGIIEQTSYVSSGQFESHWQLNGLDNYDIPTYLLANKESRLGSQLEAFMEQYNHQVMEIMGEEIIASKKDVLNRPKIGIDLDFRTELSYNQDADWQEKLFYVTPLAGTLCLLTSLQNQALNSELNGLMLLKSSVK